MSETQWRLDWSDEFDYEGKPSEENWSFIVGYPGFNKELQRYTDSLKNSFVKDGLLRIETHIDKVSAAEFKVVKSTIESYGGKADELEREEITSARLVSYGKREFSNAKVEVRARFSDGRGSWPAIWLLGDESKQKWPACGEIDIMEHVGQNPNVIHSSVHSKDYNFRNREHSTKKTRVDSVEDFHVYAVEWSDESITFSVDDEPYHVLERGERSDENWPFLKKDQYHIILNIAVGGGWAGAKGLDKLSFPYFMEVDYVRVYEKNELVEIPRIYSDSLLGHITSIVRSF